MRKSKSPPIAYVAFSFSDRFEIWPLAAIAFPVWGPIRSGKSVSVGGTKIRLFSDSASPTPFPRSRDRVHILDVEMKRKKAVVLERRVVILGDNHPSTLRMHDAGLTLCDHALVCDDHHCWLLSLDLELPVASRVRELRSGFPGVMIGNIMASFRSKDRTVKVASIELQPNSSGHEATEDSSDSSGSIKMELLPPPGPAKKPEKKTERFIDTNPVPPGPEGAVPATVLAVSNKEGIASAVRPPHAARLGEMVFQPAAQSNNEADELAEQVTERLVTMGNQRQHQRRYFQLAGLGALILASLAVVIWVFVKVSPILSRLLQD